jgi:hypothetical protein
MLMKKNNMFKRKIVVYAVVIATFALVPMGMIAANVASAATDSAEVIDSHPNKGNHFAIGHYKKVFADKPFQGVAVIGTISSVSLTNIVVKDKNNISYTVDALNAKITNGIGKHAQVISITDLKIGDTIGVVGAVSGTSVSATSIFKWVEDFGKADKSEVPKEIHFEGIVLSVNGTTFTFQSHGKGKNASIVNYTVNTTDSTVFKKDGQPGSLGDVAVGRIVKVQGDVNYTTNTILATNVDIKIPSFKGNITAVNGSNFTIQNSHGKGANASVATYTVNTTASTVFKKGRQAATLSDIVIGKIVKVIGAFDPITNTISATIVNISNKIHHGKN